MSLRARIARLWLTAYRPFKVGFAVAALAALVVVLVPNFYTSQAEVLPTSQNPMGGLAAAAAAFGLQAPVGLTDDGNYADIVDSYWEQAQLLEATYTFHQQSWRFGAEKLRQERLLDYLDAPNVDLGQKSLRKIMTVEKDIKTGLLTISVTTRSPELSQQIASKAVDLLQTFLLTQTQTKGGQKAAFVEGRLQEARNGYAKAEADLAAFMAVNLNFEASSDPHVKLRAARLQAELDFQRQVVGTLMTAREQALLDKTNDTPVLNVLDHGNLPQAKSAPKRAMITLLCFVLACAAAFAWDQKTRIRAQLFVKEEAP